jgi:hypothetical protein
MSAHEIAAVTARDGADGTDAGNMTARKPRRIDVVPYAPGSQTRRSFVTADRCSQRGKRTRT